MRKQIYENLEKELERKSKRREKRKKAKMKVSGAGVKKLEELIRKKITHN